MPSADDGGVPDFDAAAIGRIARFVELEEIELVASHFERHDAEPLPNGEIMVVEPDSIGIGGRAQFDQEGHILGVLISLAVIFETDPPPFNLVAEFRLKYSIHDDAKLAEDDLTQFVTYNAVHNVWAYWREFVTSITNRAQLPRLIVPLYRIPSRTEQSAVHSATSGDVSEES